MRLIRASALLLTLLFAPAAGLAQHVQHEDVEVIDSPPYRSLDEKRADLAAVDEYIVDRTNKFREQEGRSRLTVNDQLAATARDFADYMARTGRYGHTADGKRPADRVAAHDYEYCVVAENIAYAFDSGGFANEALGREFVEGWENSPGHRRNMLDPDVVETGAAVARSEKTGSYYAVQLFGRPKSESLEFRVANRSGSTVSYRIGDRTFKLPPRYTRTHEQCRPTEVKFELPDQGETKSAAAKAEDGGQFVITDDGGERGVHKEGSPGR
jgi:uncharacterized protein YkwD